MILVFTNARFPSFKNGQKFTIYQLIYVINELVSSKKFTNARSLLSIGLLSSGSTVFKCDFHTKHDFKIKALISNIYKQFLHYQSYILVRFLSLPFLSSSIMKLISFTFQ